MKKSRVLKIKKKSTKTSQNDYNDPITVKKVSFKNGMIVKFSNNVNIFKDQNQMS